MDDTQENGLAADELLAGSEQSEANSDENTSEDEANTETDEGAANEGEADSSEDEQDEDGQPKRKKRSGVERLRRQNEALRAELDALRSRQPVDSGDVEKAVLAEIGEPPKEADFNGDFLAFERAMIAYEADKRLVTREIKKTVASQAAQMQARKAEVFEAYDERLNDAEKAIPGLKATIAKADVQIRNDVIDLIVESEKGPLLAHYLAKNPTKAAELNRLPPLAAAKEVGRLEARLSLPKPNSATKAPAPVAPVKGGAAPSDPSRELDGWLKQKYGR